MAAKLGLIWPTKMQVAAGWDVGENGGLKALLPGKHLFTF
jgi:hypothetical protein